MTTRSETICVFDYLDFRAYLADYYAHQKSLARGFSFRNFARHAGLRSPNHLKLVIDGARPLTLDAARNYTRALRITGEEAGYFLDLVEFNQAEGNATRAAAYQRLSGRKGYRKTQTLDAQHAAYYSKWYIPAIRELAMRSDFEGDPKWIAARMVPTISVKEAAHALDVLVALKLLSRGEDGSWAVTDWVLMTPDATRGVHLAAYHRAMLAKASQSIDVLPGSERNLSAVTFCTNEATFPRIVERVKRFRQELVSMASLEDDGSTVLHVGIQVFPLARDPKGSAP